MENIIILFSFMIMRTIKRAPTTMPDTRGPGKEAAPWKGECARIARAAVSKVDADARVARGSSLDGRRGTRIEAKEQRKSKNYFLFILSY